VDLVIRGTVVLLFLADALMKDKEQERLPERLTPKEKILRVAQFRKRGLEAYRPGYSFRQESDLD